MPSAWEFLHEHLLHYFAAEGRLWRTLRALVLHPGRLTLEYLRGRKRTYVLPLRLYLTASIVYFFALQLATAPADERVRSEFHRKLNDAAAICAAVRRPDMRWVAIKSAEQQSVQSLHRMRARLMQERTAKSNQIRSMFAEEGFVFATSITQLRKGVVSLISREDGRLTPILRRITIVADCTTDLFLFESALNAGGLHT